MKNIEVEFRSQIDKKKYQTILGFLSKHGKDLGADNKRVWFFVTPDKLLKVTNNISKQTAKITLKLARIGHGSSFEEIEFPIAEKDVEKAVRLFEELGHKYLVEPTILRRDFLYKGVEIAIKYSKTWGYHLELEIMIGSKSEERSAEMRIRAVAKELGIKVMNDEELQALTGKIEATYVNPTRLSKIR